MKDEDKITTVIIILGTCISALELFGEQYDDNTETDKGLQEIADKVRHLFNTLIEGDNERQ